MCHKKADNININTKHSSRTWKPCVHYKAGVCGQAVSGTWKESRILKPHPENLKEPANCLLPEVGHCDVTTSRLWERVFIAIRGFCCQKNFAIETRMRLGFRIHSNIWLCCDEFNGFLHKRKWISYVRRIKERVEKTVKEIRNVKIHKIFFNKLVYHQQKRLWSIFIKTYGKVGTRYKLTI